MYLSLRNQSSFSTNHLEAGEHINGKKNMLKHLPIDFTVPLVAERKMAAALWRGDGGALRPPPPLGALPGLDPSEPSSQDALIAQGSAAITARSQWPTAAPVVVEGEGERRRRRRVAEVAGDGVGSLGQA